MLMLAISTDELLRIPSATLRFNSKSKA